ncbi:MAG: hypothetical protein O3B96_01365, partial [bacterium]|nr:hypothetical protein [bacterium]
MRYTKSRSNLSSSRQSTGRQKSKGIFVLVLLLIAGIWFFTRSEKAPQEITDSEPTETVFEQADEDMNPQQISNFDESPVFFKNTELEAGFIRRGIENDRYVIVSVLDLPAINQDVHFYELWLVKPGITDYFSLGVLERRSDEKWAMIYEDDDGLYDFESIEGYSEVIVTRELLRGDDLP